LGEGGCSFKRGDAVDPLLAALEVEEERKRTRTMDLDALVTAEKVTPDAPQARRRPAGLRAVR
jgi:hypothetical protein